MCLINFCFKNNKKYKTIDIQKHFTEMNLAVKMFEILQLLVYPNEKP